MNMKPLLLLLLACVGLADLSPAATNIASTSASKAAADGGRFLFVVNTSSSMRRIEAPTRQAVFDMVFTGLDGYMRSGDTFGLWTFNEEIQAGDFPMQVWDTQNPMDAAARVAAHLRTQRYSGGSDTSALMPKLQSVIGAVRNVTVFIVMDAGTKFEGTSFDESANNSIQRQAREQARVKKPFITTIIAREGRIAAAFVTIAGQPINLPERPAPALVKKPAAPVTVPDATHASTPAPPPIPQRVKVTEIVSKTNAPKPLIESNTAAPAVVAAPTPPAPKSVPAPQLVATQQMALIITNAAKVTNDIVASTVAKVEPLPPAPAPPVQSLEPEPALKPVPPAFTSLMPKPKMTVSARELMPQPIESQVPVEPLDASVPSLQAAAVVPQPGLSPMVLLIIGGLLLASAMFLIAVVLRRLRPAPQPSLISQSMDRR